MPGKNAVVKRIEHLTKKWREFTQDSQARIQCWRLNADAGRLLDAFLAYHGEECSDLDDLFLPIVVPASNAQTYWEEVQQQLELDIHQARGDFEALDIPADWQAPARAAGVTPAQHLIDTLASFQAFHQELFEHAVIVLLPTEIASRELWLECMDQLVACHDWPVSARFLVPDWLPETTLHDWAIRHATRVKTVTPRLDMPGLPLELLAHVPGNGPGFEFRRLFVQLSAAATTGQITQVPNLARQALRIADAQGWFALGATVQLLVGGAMAAAGQSKEVLASYREARRLAAKVTDPSGPKMVVTSAMAEAGAMLGQGDYRAARTIYLEAAREAEQGSQTMSSMDARRMASYCAEQNGDLDAAWEDAQAAVRIARNLEGDARRDSTLPVLLNRMQEIARKPEMLARNLNVERECQELLGTQWTGILDRTRTLLS